jgi:hypothetical protein
MWNILVGVIFIIGGLSGELALIGTNSGTALAVMGFVLVGWGAYKMMRR